MISHKHKFILITPPKTASTSITKSLIDIIEVTRIEKNRSKNCFDFYEPKIQQKSKHKKLSGYNQQYIETYKLYGTVRNPYERMVSWWKWTSKKQSFESFVKKFNISGKNRKPCLDFFCSRHKNIESYIRFENLEEDYIKFCKDVGLTDYPLQNINKTQHSSYKKYYNEKTFNKVSRIWKKDIDYFHYKF